VPERRLNVWPALQGVMGHTPERRTIRRGRLRSSELAYGSCDG
jgi:hypothetical protein